MTWASERSSWLRSAAGVASPSAQPTSHVTERPSRFAGRRCHLRVVMSLPTSILVSMQKHTHSGSAALHAGLRLFGKPLHNLPKTGQSELTNQIL